MIEDGILSSDFGGSSSNFPFVEMADRWSAFPHNIILIASYTTYISSDGHRKPALERKLPSKLTCFEDLYLSTSLGVWFSKPESAVSFRKRMLKQYSEPKAAVDEKEKDAVATKKRKEYCGRYYGHEKLVNGPKTKTNARIMIFQRTKTRNLRAFINLEEVKLLAQEYTNVPVEVITVNADTTMIDQIRMFNSFDVMLTPHGSHLTNGIFTVRPSEKAIVEIDSFAFDQVFYANFNAHLGYGAYIISTGHLTPKQAHTHDKECFFDSPDKFQILNCVNKTHSYPKQNDVKQTFLECPVDYNTKECDTLVNLDILRANLNFIFDNFLCQEE